MNLADFMQFICFIVLSIKNSYSHLTIQRLFSNQGTSYNHNHIGQNKTRNDFGH